MTEQASINSGKIAAAVSKAYKNGADVPVRAVCRRLRRRTHALRQYYLRLSAAQSHQPWEEWLCDNYYVLEKESKQSLKDIRQLEKCAVPGELARFYAVFLRVLGDAMPPICDETVTAILRQAARHGAVSERQFSFIPAAIKAVLVELAYRACFEVCSADLMAYAVTGLIHFAAVDLERIIQACSGVESVLEKDPAGVYPAMNSESRAYYRSLIARIATQRREGEEAVALRMLAACEGKKGAQAHIGHPILHHELVVAPRRRRGKLALVLGIVLPLLVAAGLGLLCRNAAVAVLTFLPLWEILRTPVQQAAMAGVDVDFIPRMNLKKVPDKPKTAVLVTTLLPKAGEAPRLTDRLEQLYYSNSDPDMYYCLLVDLPEWQYPSDEKDESQIAAARKVIEALNTKHGGRFMLFLRARTYSRTQNKYTGWERKRGAVIEFIRFLRGGKTSLKSFVGDREVLPEIKFLIALDADTNLLYESAQTLVAAAVHPLNRPVVGPDGVVVDGYGILVPKIDADLDSARRTAFSRVMTGCGGVTAYETRDKDFYQDLFGDSIFAGKGLIDVDCFYELLDGRFPENHILSHDILEGAYLRVGFVTDAGMTDGAPRSMLSWLSRLHRWMRGDWQNLPFIGRRVRAGGHVYENAIGTLSKYKLFDNLRRSLTPVAALLCVAASLAAPRPAALALVLCGVLATTFPSLWVAFWALIGGGVFTLSRKFFTRTLPHTLELCAQAGILLVMLPAQALVTADAAARSLWRTYISHRKMLEWQTAAQSDARNITVLAVLGRFWLPELVSAALFVLGFPTALCLPGLAFLLAMPVAYFTARTSADDKSELTAGDRDTLISYNAAMWRYYEDFANAKNHYLPPDNVQQSPVYRVAARTSPTNIGMMLLSVLAARDLDFIDTDGLYVRVERTISAVERLAKWNGNLYNWYDTETLGTLKPEFVSTVDSGNFICCMVALAQGLREFAGEKRRFGPLIARIEAIVEATDLTVFYNKKKKLFSIGYDVDSGELVGSHYDFLMSEARLTSYYAVARKIVGKKHWGALNRTMSRNGYYAGAVSWTGTMFEYFMPHLLLPVCEGSLLSEALIYCLYCHKRRVRGLGVPWGISESAFYAFDNSFNYQYKAHGVQKLGVKRSLDRELVISPYSTFITVPYNPNSSMENLRSLRELGVYGRYGFFEAVDFTEERVGDGALAVTRSYMAHHIGMSMVSSCNALFDYKMQKRFMRDPYMRSAKEFLQERIAKSTVVYDDLTKADNKNEKHERPKIQRDDGGNISPLSPRCVLLTNGEITDVMTDSGMGYLKFGEIDLTRRSGDLLRRAQGFVAVVRANGRAMPATLAPFYDADTQYSVEYGEHSVTYFAKQKGVETGLRCAVHPTISCEQRQLVVKNTGSQKLLAQVLLYFEPTLARGSDYAAHPAFSKLFVSGVFDEESKTVTFSRRERDSSVNMFLTVGFLQDVEFQLETRREALQSSPNGMQELLQFHKKTFSGNAAGTPDICCALRFDLSVPAGGQAQATLLVCAARSQQEGITNIISMRRLGVLEEKDAAKSPLLGESLESRLGASLLGHLLFGHTGAGDFEARRACRLGQSGLWATGISGDLPIALLELDDGFDRVVLTSYLRLHRSLRSLQVEFDLCLLCEGEGPRELRAEILGMLDANRVGGMLGSRGGVFVLEKAALAPEQYTLLRATARHITTGALPAAQAAGGVYRPMRLRGVSAAPMPERPALAVEGGAFHEGRFYVDRQSPLPYCHILANPAFGTLVSDRALGYTWAVNSRENKLTPWYNDICTDNEGELLLLREGGVCYNLLSGARASFSRDDALYEGRIGKLSVRVRVTVSGAGMAKYIDVTLENRADAVRQVQCAYYTEPVLGVLRDTARHICPQTEQDGRTLVLTNYYNTAVRCSSAITVRGGGAPRFSTDRAAFLCGEWDAGAPAPNNDPCAAAVVPLELPPGEAVRVRFVFACGHTAESAAWMAAHALPASAKPEAAISIHTPDEALNQYINHFAVHQITASRIRGRTAFFQCGGAYGFRDQLQDVCALLYTEPALARRQILRCCAVQFEEGDVLHWWHALPGGAGGLRGVRTRFSDDFLWLPYAVARYVHVTGDEGLLSVPVAFLTGAPLLPKEHEKYFAPQRGSLREDVYNHCLRALEYANRLDARGLPSIGCGDWCDGYSSVGLDGKGSSVWLAMFLAMVLGDFAPLCETRGDLQRAETLRRRARALREAVDTHAWDGAWYVRAFFDDGQVMGASANSECKIDLLPQAFAALSGMPDKKRMASALDSALSLLVDGEMRTVSLFTPPFQHSEQQPGYVKAYPGGIRENGGQYTHAAVWFAIALLKAGRVEEGACILSMLCPADRCRHPRVAHAYGVEPYYIAADIYTSEHAPGHGGWSMYTGAAAWYYRAVVEVLFGVEKHGRALRFTPRLPKGWDEARMELQLESTRLAVRIRRGEEAAMLYDGAPVQEVPLEGGSHIVEVVAT